MSVYDELVGQEHVVAQLRHAAAAAADRRASGMAHAWLFTGPPGSGRSVAARAFAAALQCRRGGTPQQGCGECDACHQVLAGTHADLELIRPAGLSFSVKDTRNLVLRSSGAPTVGNYRIVLFEDADRATEQAANALLKAIEEPPPRTVWLLCTPAPDDLVVTIRSRCRLVTLRTPATESVTAALMRRDGVDTETATAAARAAGGHIGRARRLATDPQARARRTEVLQVPQRIGAVDGCLHAAEQLVKAAESEAAGITGELDESERSALRRAYGEGSSGKGVTKAIRGAAGAMRDLEARQKSRATRLKRDALDRALLDLAGYYRDVLVVQLGARVETANETAAGSAPDSGADPQRTLRRIEAIMQCRDRIAANANPQLSVEAMTLALRAP